MAKSKYQMTGCARFFIFMLFIIPVAYFGAQYMRDNGLLDKVKETYEEISKDSDHSPSTADPSPNPSVKQDFDVDEYQRKLEQLLRAMELQKERINELEISNTDKDALISKLQEELNKYGALPPSDESTQETRQKSIQDLLKEADKALKKSGNQ